MSLMKLSPETVRLRRIAKAFAAGEFSEEEYRLARREVIVNFVPMPLDDDDTQPRAPVSEPEVERRQTRAAPRRRLWILTLFGVGLLLAAIGSFASAAPVIPALAERDPNPVTSPRLMVEQVYLAEFQALPGVSAGDVDARIAAKLAELRARQQPGEHGFTGDELQELGRLLNALGVHDQDATGSQAAWEDVRALVAQQKQRRGLSIVELEEVAADVQALYRDAGYFLAVGYLPSQQVEAGSVRIAVLPGVLGEVRVSSGSEKVAARFADLIGQPLDSETVTTRLYALNQAPGLQAQASFEPGQAVGETTLNLEVAPQKTWQGAMSVDNHGDSGTGEGRLLADVSLLNPTGRGDVLDFGLIGSLEGVDQVYGYLGYTRPLAGRNRLLTSVAYTDFSTGLDNSAESVDSDGWLYDLAFGHTAYQSRQRSLSFQFGGGYQQLDWRSNFSAADASQDVYFANARVDAARVWDQLRVAADASVAIEAGGIDGETFAGQDSEYWRLKLSGFAWRPLDLPLLPGEQKLSLALNGQLADMQLPATKRMALGGTLANRAYRRDAYLVDSGALLRVDLRTPVRLGDIALFADAAYGETLNDLDSNWAYLSGVGLAWSFRLAGVESRLSWAVPISSDGSGEVDDDGSQVFWSFSYRR